ncbi:MAG: PIN domain nuclease, partial [Chloracidobacterium sp.]
MHSARLFTQLILVLLSLGIALLVKPSESALWSATLGLGVGGAVVAIEYHLRSRPMTTLLGGLLGLLAGLAAATLIGLIISLQPGLPDSIKTYVALMILL